MKVHFHNDEMQPFPTHKIEIELEDGSRFELQEVQLQTGVFRLRVSSASGAFRTIEIMPWAVNVALIREVND
jgi:hypothetical protein